MLGVSLARWSDLQPTDERCLTQLGGLLCVRDGRTVYEYKDNGICAPATSRTSWRTRASGLSRIGLATHGLAPASGHPRC